MTKDELITWAKANGFTEDRFGHLQKANGTSRYRLKLSSIAARYEVTTSAGCYARMRHPPAMPNPGLCRMARGEGRGSCGGHGRRRAQVLLRSGIVRVPVIGFSGTPEVGRLGDTGSVWLPPGTSS